MSKKTKKESRKSVCCNSKVKIEGMNDFDKQCTMYYSCGACGKPCDVIRKVRRTWAINPKTRIVPSKKAKNINDLSAKEIRKFLKEEDF